MESPATPITQKLLVNAGGWPAMKNAQALQKAGRVSEAKYEAPVLSGMVREGNRNLRSGLRVKSASDVENLCTCREAREWGTICAHALAVGLQYIEPTTAPPPAPAAKSLALVKAPSPNFVEAGRENAPLVTLYFILPPQFDSAWEKNQIMLVIESERNGQRAMLSTLSPNETYALDAFDLAAMDALDQLSDERLAAMRMLSRAEFLQLLEALRHHPRVTFGKAKKAEITGEIFRPDLLLQRGARDEVILRLKAADQGRLLLADSFVWWKEGLRLQPLAEGFPTEFAALADGPMTLRSDSARRFLAFEAVRLSRWCNIESAGDLVLPEVCTAVPEFLLSLEGSMRQLRAELFCRYGDGGKFPLVEKSPAELEFVRDSPNDKIVLLRDLAAESAAVVRLQDLGFALEKKQFVLRQENLIGRFFAFAYPRLAQEWKVTLSAQAEHAHEQLQPLAPTIEIVSSGENWFELRYALTAPGGETLPAPELQRLLRSGQSQTRLRNGRAGVFDPVALADFEEVLRDCEPSQTEPGVYRIDRAHAGYLAASSAEAGAELVDLRGGLQKFAAAAEENPKAALGQLGERLRDYQLDGVGWLRRLAASGLGGILADEMGLGKTVQTLAFLSLTNGGTTSVSSMRSERTGQRPSLQGLRGKPALIVCPSSLVANWRNEAGRFTPDLRVLVLDGPDRHERFPQIAESDIVITSYALLQRDAERYRAIEFASAILDEAQHIKNPDTQNARAAFALRARHRFVLTGTPIENSVRDLWSLMQFAVPGYLGSRSDFRERYELPLSRGAPEVQQRLTRRIRPFLLRRTKREVAKDLPEKIEQVMTCDLSTAQRATYDGLLREIQSGVAGSAPNEAATRMKMLLGLLRLRQVCCDLRLLGEEVVKTSAPSAKLELLDELLEEAIDGGHRVLVFSQFVSMLALIRARLEAKSIPFSYLDGQSKDRQGIVDRFTADASVPVFLMSLKAGGVGLNLAAADTVIHFDPWWNYAAEAQATDRAHRIGQTRVVNAYKLIARGTVEEKIVQLQTRKRAASEATIGSEEPLMSGLTSAELEELLS